MMYLGLGVFTYIVIGTVITALTNSRSTIDLILDVFLWPVILYYYLRWRV